MPLDFFGRTVPLLTVERRGSVAIIGLAGRKKRTTEATFKRRGKEEIPIRNRPNAPEK